MIKWFFFRFYGNLILKTLLSSGKYIIKEWEIIMLQFLPSIYNLYNNWLRLFCKFNVSSQVQFNKNYIKIIYSFISDFFFIKINDS